MLIENGEISSQFCGGGIIIQRYTVFVYVEFPFWRIRVNTCEVGLLRALIFSAKRCLLNFQYLTCSFVRNKWIGSPFDPTLIRARIISNPMVELYLFLVLLYFELDCSHPASEFGDKLKREIIWDKKVKLCKRGFAKIKSHWSRKILNFCACFKVASSEQSKTRYSSSWILWQT